MSGQLGVLFPPIGSWYVVKLIFKLPRQSFLSDWAHESGHERTKLQLNVLFFLTASFLSILQRTRVNAVQTGYEGVFECVCACEERGTVIYGADLRSNSLFSPSWFVKSLGDMHRCDCDHPAEDACRGRYFFFW